MWRFVLDRGKEGAGIAVNTVNTELIRSGTPGTGWFVRLGLVSFNRIESVGMVVEPDSITQAEFISSGRYLAKLCNDVTNIILHTKPFIAFQILFTAYCPCAKPFPKTL